MTEFGDGQMETRFRKFVMGTLTTISLCGLCGGASRQIPTLDIGTTAPDFNLPGTDGKMYSIKSFSDSQILAVIFTCNHCPTAQAYEQRIMSLHSDYKGKGVAVVAITPNDPNAVRLDELGYTDLCDSFEETKLRAKEKGFEFPYLYDGENQKVSLVYGPVSTPHVFIFDKDRKLRYVGGIDNSENPKLVKKRFVRDALDALLASKPVAVEKTKTFGCSIKWADKRKMVERAFAKWAKEEVGLETIDRQKVAELLKNKSDNLMLLNTWATWCGPCVIEFPELVTINRIYRGREFEMVTISLDTPNKKEKVIKFLKKQQASCRNYLWESNDKNEFSDVFDEKWRGEIPYTLIIKPGGEIIYRHAGIIEPLEVKKVIVEYIGRYFF